MIDTHLKTQLEKATLDLDKTTDVEGILIVARDGQILHHNLRVDVDINLFGPMSQVISNSSHRLLSSSGQGELERVLVESSGGKALFLGLENAHLIILMLDSANVGLVMVNAKRASQLINEATQDLEFEVPPEIPEEAPEIKVEEIPAEEVKEESADISMTEEVVAEEISAEDVQVEEAPVEKIKAKDEAVEVTEEPVLESEKIIEKPAVEPAAPEPPEIKTELEAQELEKLTADETVIEKTEPEIVETKPKEIKPSIPTVKPPISFPPLPQDVQVPDEAEKRSELILDIYEAIFLAMSMGAAKIMGVAPARGLTKQFLPFEKCPKLLHNVELKSNATIDFAQIKKNAADIPVQEREKVFIQDFSRMIEVITENYGRVMGYEAFRGMVRAEFMEIKKSYGNAMDKLNIKEKIHPEIAQLFT